MMSNEINVFSGRRLSELSKNGIIIILKFQRSAPDVTLRRTMSLSRTEADTNKIATVRAASDRFVDDQTKPAQSAQSGGTIGIPVCRAERLEQ